MTSASSCTLPKAHERLLEKAYQDRLRSALQKHFGAKAFACPITVGEGNGSSPVADRATRTRRASRREAIAEIEQDPFVRELVENFDARIERGVDQTLTVERTS